MKKFVVSLVVLMATATMSFGQSYVGNSLSGLYGTGVNCQTTIVRGYTKNNGTYVNGYTRTSRNSTNHDNYSTTGNRNPYTGTTGARARDYSNGAYNYGVGHTNQTGSRGGQYYVNGNGNNVYVPKRSNTSRLYK